MGIETLATVLYYVVVAVSVVYSYTSAQKAKKQAKGAANSQKGLLYQSRATAQPRRLVYGRRRIGGLDTWIGSTGTDNEYFHFILTWCDGPVQRVAKLLADGVEVPLDSDGNVVSGPYLGLIKVKHRLGDSDNFNAPCEVNGTCGRTTNIPTPGDYATVADWRAAYDAWIVANPSDGTGVPGWTPNHLLIGVCYSWIRIKYDIKAFPNGMPNWSAVIEGCNDIFDPRTGQYVYTDNVQLCFVHWLTRTRTGPAVSYQHEIDEDSMIDSANACDVDVPLLLGGTEKKFTFNGILELDNETESFIERFRTAMAGTASYI